MMLRVGLVVLMVVGMLAIVMLGVAMADTKAAPVEGAAAPAGEGGPSPLKSLGVAVGAAFVGGLSILGAGLAVGRVGSAAVGAITEKPELFVRALIFVALAEGLAVLGFALAYILMMRM
jgi:V/A-type H+/Na+-transporting ATPase subunit K